MDTLTAPSPASAAVPRPTWAGRLARRLHVGPMLLMHLACLSALFVPMSAAAVILCGVLYAVRMFGITAGFHRYFSHRAYKTSRVFQFLLACLGCSAFQRGPLWWAAHHRSHHRHSDQDGDPHSPVTRGVLWSHLGWITSREYDDADLTEVRDFSRYPELRLLDQYHWVPGVLLIGLCYLIAGRSGVAWFFVSTVLLYHGTFLVNSACHIFGRKRYQTGDESRNNAVVAILTLGEGWHNNHHKYQSSANQGFFWWEVDLSCYTLRVLSLFGLVWGLRKPPLEKLEKSRVGSGRAAENDRLAQVVGVDRGES